MQYGECFAITYHLDLGVAFIGLACGRLLKCKIGTMPRKIRKEEKFFAFVKMGNENR